MSQVLDTVSAAEALERHLELRILDGELRPGMHLREIELCEYYQVGRHTLRAAFEALVRGGLLERERNRGVFVRVLTAADLTEIYELRTAVEVQAFRMLAQRRYVPPAATEAIAALNRINSRSPQREFVEADLAFHSAIVHGTRNARLIRVHDGLRAEILLLLAQLATRYASVRQLAREHNELVAAIALGPPTKAETAIRAHLERAAEWLATHSATAEPLPE